MNQTGHQGFGSSLNPEQRAAVNHEGGPLLVLAPAGSGKTRVVIERLLHLISRSGESGERFFVATFTRKAAGELVERISRQLPETRLPWVGTFHSLSARLLRQFAVEADLSPGFTIFDGGDQRALVRELMKRQNIPETDLNPQDVIRQIGRWKNAGKVPGPDLAQRLFGTQKWTATLYEEYEKGLGQNRALDYDDLLLKLVGLLTRRREIAQGLRDHFHHILVDEYQDTNPLQEELIRLLSRDRSNVTVVGDDDQSIYQFRGADIRHIRSFGEEYPGARRIVLSRNYRSTPTIVSAASSVIARNSGRYSKEVTAVRNAGSPVLMKELSDEEAEARYAAGEVREWVAAGGSFGDSAILFRTHAQALPFEKALATGGIPYFRKGGGGFLERKEIKDLLSYLRVMVNPFDRVGLKRILNTPGRGLGDRAQETLDLLIASAPVLPSWELLDRLSLSPRQEEKARELSSLLREGSRRASEEGWPPHALLEDVIGRTSYRSWIEQESLDANDRERRLSGVRELLEMARPEERGDPEWGGEGRSLASVFLEEIALSQQDPPEESERGRVALMTIHQAKGLEFDQVFVVGCEDQLLPIRGKSPTDIEEERRLFYVAMTRARVRLHLTWCQTRRIYGRSQSYAPSPFLRDIPPLHRRGDSPESSRSGKGAGRTGSAPPRERREVDFRPGFQGRPSPAHTGKVPAGRRLGPEEPPSPQRIPRPEWIGRTVQHPRFGRGEVLDAFSPDPDLEVVIRFDDGRERTLLARVANLQIVGGPANPDTRTNGCGAVDLPATVPGPFG
jgi:DNA helicase-2/ATP-dependent DNA helicase PcrA